MVHILSLYKASQMMEALPYILGQPALGSLSYSAYLSLKPGCCLLWNEWSTQGGSHVWLWLSSKDVNFNTVLDGDRAAQVWWALDEGRPLDFMPGFWLGISLFLIFSIQSTRIRSWICPLSISHICSFLSILLPLPRYLLPQSIAFQLVSLFPFLLY